MSDSAIHKYLEELEEKFMNGELDEEEKSKKSGTLLLHLVFDKSYPTGGFSGLEECIKNSIAKINDICIEEKALRYLQVAITDFGSRLNIQPFAYRESIDANAYMADQTQSRVYDAVIESALYMCSQYDELIDECRVRAFMFVFTDGEDNGSKNSLQDMKKAIKELRKRDIVLFPILFKGADSNQLSNIFGSEPVNIDGLYEIRRRLRLHD